MPFSIDFDRRPYNTLALPCECVMIVRTSHVRFYVSDEILYAPMQHRPVLLVAGVIVPVDVIDMVFVVVGAVVVVVAPLSKKKTKTRY